MPDLGITVRTRLNEIRKNAQRAAISADEERDERLATLADDAEALADALLAILDSGKDVHWHGPAVPLSKFPELRTEETGACRTCVEARKIAAALGLDARMPDDEAWERAESGENDA